jgi:hypothetical protein
VKYAPDGQSFAVGFVDAPAISIVSGSDSVAAPSGLD